MITKPDLNLCIPLKNYYCYETKPEYIAGRLDRFKYDYINYVFNHEPIVSKYTKNILYLFMLISFADDSHDYYTLFLNYYYPISN